DMIGTLGALVGAAGRAAALRARLEARLAEARAAAPAVAPRVYFEEWDDPIITGIGWVSELIEIAGGQDCFAHLRRQQAARDRIIAPQDIAAAAPEIVIGSWCGKKFAPARIAERPGWQAIPAVRNGRLYEIKSPLILQPGPAALTDGLAALSRIIRGEGVPIAP
ncbi:MAG: ABC transporter substrate-binding protein, partial [Pseudomonadota bacterium]